MYLVRSVPPLLSPASLLGALVLFTSGIVSSVLIVVGARAHVDGQTRVDHLWCGALSFVARPRALLPACLKVGPLAWSTWL